MMKGDGSPPLPQEDDNAAPLRSPAPSSSPSPSPSPSPGTPSPVTSGAGEGAAAGGGVVPMDEERSPSVARDGGASVMSNNVSYGFWTDYLLLLKLGIFDFYGYESVWIPMNLGIWGLLCS